MTPRVLVGKYNGRIPLVIRRRNADIYFQLQIEIAQDNGLGGGLYCEFSKISTTVSPSELGSHALKLLERFLEIGDMTIAALQEITGVKKEECEAIKHQQRLEFFNIKNGTMMLRFFDECSIDYDLLSKKYKFVLWWAEKNGRSFVPDSSSSLGKQGILTFSEPLEFYDGISSEKLGEMIVEALDRSKKIGEIMASGQLPNKEITLLDHTVVEISPPKDSHFEDREDGDVGELYQVYAYVSRADSEPSAYFSLSTAPELYKDPSVENIRSAWLEAYGETEIVNVTECNYGIFRYRAELFGKKLHKIGYFTVTGDDLVLECSLEIEAPNKRKKLEKELPELFEQFAINCKIKTICQLMFVHAQ